MSLLLDALKKAEAAKRREEESTVDSPVSPAEPLPPAPVRITPAHELELIDDEIAQAARFAGLDVPEPRSATPPPPPSGAEAARVLFDAKRPPLRERSPLVWLLAGAALLLLCVGAWVVWQIGLLENGHATTAAPMHRPAAPSVAQEPTSPASPSTSATAATPQPAATPQVTRSPSGPDLLAPTAPTLSPQAASPKPAAPTESSRFLTGQIAAVPPTSAAAPASATTVPIRITRNAPSVPKDVTDGFAAFNAGEFDLARAAYERALRADPRNPDALHGLAALAQQRGDEAQARMLLRRVADVDPADTSAQVALSENGDPAMQEARLLNIAATQPGSASAALALGNLYAAQTRWREAQQAYFNAFTLAPEQPDHAFNLAVSLDQLRQHRLALQYYREAVALRGQRAAAFDMQAVTARIEALQAQLQENR